MEHKVIKVIKVTFQYPEYDNEGNNVIANRECVVKYEFELISKRLTVSIEGQNSITINGFDLYDLDDVSTEISSILPDDIVKLGAPISLIENFILGEFLRRSDIVHRLNNTVFTVCYEPEHQTKMILSCGKVLTFPTTGSEYFNLTLEQLL